MEAKIETKKKTIFSSTKKKVSGGELLKLFVFIFIAAIVILPMLITLFASFKTLPQIGYESAIKPPTTLYLENYKDVFKSGHVLVGFKNSMILVVAAVVINSLLSTMVAYCLTRFNFKLKKAYYAIFLVGMIIPGIVTEISRFGLITKLHVYDTLLAPILIYAGADLMQIYIYNQFLEQIPVAVDESAMIDGASYFTIYWRIIFPMVIPATATLGILKAVDVLNDMYIPFLYMPGANHKTLSTLLFNFIQDPRTSSVPKLSAAAVIVMIPTLVIYFLFQKYIFSGIAAGAVKE
ncbi:carbohydrate ABC transporter permease [Clostridium sp. YIM B02515]|uniref:Carbohydrate ABC transporter permease n=1 Tax=Clostridium rhizosphaerae TaxID=2803861 RepID=A0ABS1TB64_9CLOT|nr:carbohydrate ABC transporter permease [Clostridium rhizosphaerae]MBL4935992.1 carbohydrate ABC transporter permease [Clostridium rhizosphaerae]